jgi:hypothetical protein
VFTQSDRSVYSREDCIEAAAEALARCWERVEARDNTTAPAEARAV